MHRVVVVWIVWILMSALPAHPLPLGKTDQQLYADSDLVAEVLVVAVTFLGEEKNSVGGHDKSYEALLRVLKVIKGPSDPPTTITSSWTEHVPPMLGSQTVPFSQGERALVYMVREQGHVSACVVERKEAHTVSWTREAFFARRDEVRHVMSSRAQDWPGADQDASVRLG